MRLIKQFFGETKNFDSYNWRFFGIILLIFLIGVFNLYSATHANPRLANIWKMQLVWFGLSGGVFLVTSFIRIETYRRFSFVLYFLILVSLILVMVMGVKGMGARRWLQIGPLRIQPSEFAKISLILVLANWYSLKAKVQDLGWQSIIVPAILTFIPMGMIMKQPDLGTALILFFLFSVFVFVQRLKWKDMLKLLGVLGVLAALMYNFGLKEYQKRRIRTFINPTSDARGAGYNVIQSKIAIGSGQVIGKGFLNSTQASLYFLPENHTDFAFSVYAEERGLFGALILLGLFLWLIFEILSQAMNLRNLFASLVSVGVAAFLFVHVFINIAMVMGLLPVVGLPLPFISYGGSSLLSFSIALGVLTSASRSKAMFGIS